MKKIIIISLILLLNISFANEKNPYRIPGNFIQISAGAAKAPGISPATFVSLGLDGAWQFADNKDDTVSMAMAIPSNMNRDFAPSIRIGWSSPATTGACIWEVKYKWLTVGDDSSTTTPDGTVVCTDNVSSVANGYTYCSFELVQPSDTDRIIQILITRKGSDDTLSDVANFLGMLLAYETSRLN